MGSKEYKHKWYLEHRDLTIERAKKWNKSNPEKRKQIIARNNKNSAIRKRIWHEQKTFGGNATLEGKACEKCGSNNRIGIHHRDGNNGKRGKLMNNNPNNLMVLCNSCHALVHGFGRFKEI